MQINITCTECQTQFDLYTHMDNRATGILTIRCPNCNAVQKMPIETTLPGRDTPSLITLKGTNELVIRPKPGIPA